MSSGYTKAEIAEQQASLRRHMAWLRHTAEKVNVFISDLEMKKYKFEDRNMIELTNLYLYASECYYVHDESIMTDGMFDGLCKYLYTNFDILEMVGVWHVGSVIVEGNLEAGSCIGVEFPVPVQNIAHFIREVQAQELAEMLS